MADIFDQVEAAMKEGTPSIMDANAAPAKDVFDSLPEPQAPVPPTDPTLKQMILPRTTQPGEKGLIDTVLDPVADVLEVPSRLLGAGTNLDGARGKNPDGSDRSFGQAMADPETSLARGANERLEKRKQELQAIIDNPNSTAKEKESAQVNLDLADRNQTVNSVLADPTTFVGAGVAKKMAPKAAELAAKGGEKVIEFFRKTKIRVDDKTLKVIERNGKKVDEVLKEEGFHKGMKPEKALEKASKQKAEVGAKIEDLIQNAKKEGVKVDISGPISRMRKQIDDDAANGLIQDADAKAMRKVVEEFEETIKKLGDPTQIDVDIANNLKKSFQGKVYDKTLPSGKYQKKMADGLQYEINQEIGVSLGKGRGEVLKKLNSKWQNNKVIEDMMDRNRRSDVLKDLNSPSGWDKTKEIAKKAAPYVGGLGLLGGGYLGGKISN